MGLVETECAPCSVDVYAELPQERRVIFVLQLIRANSMSHTERGAEGGGEEKREVREAEMFPYFLKGNIRDLMKPRDPGYSSNKAI